MDDWPLLDGLPEEDVRRLVSVARRRRFGRSEVVFHQGDPADSLHLIVKGRFAVRFTTQLGDVSIFAIRRKGDAFGELALVDRTAVRSATVSALEPGETLCVYHSDFARLRIRFPSVDKVLVRLLAGQVRCMNDRLVEALFMPADDRVRRRISELCDVYVEEDGTVDIPLTQEELAGMAGTSRATVNRVLREAAAVGMVRLRRGHIIVQRP